VITSTNRYVTALIHDGLYKTWSSKIIKDFSDDYEDESDEKTQETADQKKVTSLAFTGTLNQVTPLIIKNMLEFKKGE
jgi:hypothetical protein